MLLFGTGQFFDVAASLPILEGNTGREKFNLIHYRTYPNI
jgi:hypothetical protein